MELSKEAWGVVGVIGGGLVTALFSYLGKRLVAQVKSQAAEHRAYQQGKKDERESIAVGYASLIESLQEQVDRLHEEMKSQRVECDKEIKSIKQSAEKESALQSNALKRHREEYEEVLRSMKQAHALELKELDSHYKELLLELRALQYKTNIRDQGLPGSPPA